ncbi:UNVERIFIED_CONTAM: hypothetical protein FKN15_015313 [Acipenser sinensis]
MVKTVKDLIIETLDDLKKGDLERFKNKLRDKTFQGHRIGAGKLEDASRVDIADRIVDTFTEQYAVALTVEVLNEIGQNEPARVLQARTAACEINYCYYFLYVRASESRGKGNSRCTVNWYKTMGKVSNHKTAGTFGKAVLVVSTLEHQWLLRYAAMRHKLPGYSYKPTTFFFTNKGNPIKKIGRAISKAWKYWGQGDDITTGMIRSAVVTYVRRT